MKSTSILILIYLIIRKSTAASNDYGVAIDVKLNTDSLWSLLGVNATADERALMTRAISLLTDIIKNDVKKSSAKFAVISNAISTIFPISKSDNEPDNLKPLLSGDGYSVKDFSRSDSYSVTTTGSYHIVLPDGRKQIVTYTIDESARVADVNYNTETSQ